LNSYFAFLLLWSLLFNYFLLLWNLAFIASSDFVVSAFHYLEQLIFYFWHLNRYFTFVNRCWGIKLPSIIAERPISLKFNDWHASIMTYQNISLSVKEAHSVDFVWELKFSDELFFAIPS
jgi:hypothetical protein